MGGFYTNFSITTPEFIIFLRISACLVIARFLLGVLSCSVGKAWDCLFMGSSFFCLSGEISFWTRYRARQVRTFRKTYQVGINF